MTLDNIYTFFISLIGRVFFWAYNLQIPLGGAIVVNLGDLLISVVVLGIIIRIFMYFNDFTSIFVHRDENGHVIGRTVYSNGKRKVINYYDNIE